MADREVLMFASILIAALLAGQDAPARETGAWEALDACRQPAAAPADDPDHDPDMEQIDCLVGALYGAGQLERIDVLHEHAPLIFSQAALADMAAARARSEEGLDADPFCLCQDPGGLTILASMVRSSSEGTGAAAIVFTFAPFHENMTTEELQAAMAPDQRQSLRLDFVREEAGWYVDDIVAEGWSFRQGLQP